MSREPEIPAGYPKWTHIFRDQRQMSQNRILERIVYYATRAESKLFSPKVIFTRGEIEFSPVQHTRFHPFSPEFS